MWPVAEPFKLKGVWGAEVTAVLPLNLFVPAAILAFTETSFQGDEVRGRPPRGFGYCIWVKAPVILPEAKSAENAAFPLAKAASVCPPTGAKILASAYPEKAACPVVGLEVAGVSYPKANSVTLCRVPVFPEPSR